MTINYSVMAVSTEPEMQLHELSDKWVLWAHLPHDTNWTVQSYTRILGFNTAEDAVAIMERTPEVVIKNCMLFLMRSHINPVWEDPANKSGGLFFVQSSKPFGCDGVEAALLCYCGRQYIGRSGCIRGDLWSDYFSKKGVLHSEGMDDRLRTHEPARTNNASGSLH